MLIGRTTMEITRPGPVCAVCRDYITEAGYCASNRDHVDTTMDADGLWLEVTIKAAFGDIIPGRYHGPWEDCYPDEGGELLELIATVDGDPVILTPDEHKRAVEYCWDRRRKSEDCCDLW